jgi:hypothetical protein
MVYLGEREGEDVNTSLSTLIGVEEVSDRFTEGFTHL